MTTPAPAPAPAPEPVLARYGLAEARLAPLAGGHINRSYLATRACGARAVLQWVSPIFGASVQQDIAAVTEWLRERQVPTFSLLPTLDGELFVADGTDIWRLLSFVEGETREHLSGDEEAHAAGRMLGRFHAGLADYDRPFAHTRGNVHELERHLAKLRTALDTHRQHPRHGVLAPLAEAIAAMAADEPPLPDLPPRVVHGDPKLSNMLFVAGSSEVSCLIDLDTLSRMALPLELGDAFRSWCNTGAEDDPASTFHAGRFAAALAGYRAGAGRLLSAREQALVVATTRRIAVELSVRFCADAFEESYFGFDASRFETRGEHNEARARGQLALARSVAAQVGALEQIAAAT